MPRFCPELQEQFDVEQSSELGFAGSRQLCIPEMAIPAQFPGLCSHNSPGSFSMLRWFRGQGWQDSLPQETALDALGSRMVLGFNSPGAGQGTVALQGLTPRAPQTPGEAGGAVAPSFLGRDSGTGLGASWAPKGAPDSGASSGKSWMSPREFCGFFGF